MLIDLDTVQPIYRKDSYKITDNMKLQSQSVSANRTSFVNVLLLMGIAVLLLCENSTGDEVPAFFLKIAKNIPRVGRSGRFDDYFFQSAKNIPRIGRRDGGTQPSEAWPSYTSEERFPGPTKRRMDYPGSNDWTWQHFPLAIEGPRELWRTLAGYSKDNSDDIDNEVWQRKKRTGTEVEPQRK